MAFNLKDLLGKASKTAKTVKKAATTYKKVKAGQTLSKPEQKTAKGLETISKALAPKGRTELSQGTAGTKKLTVDQILEQMKLQESAVEKQAVSAQTDPLKRLFMQAGQTQRRASDFLSTPAGEGGKWTIPKTGIPFVDIVTQPVATGAQTLLGSLQEGARGLQQVAESTDSRKTWQERLGGVGGGVVKAGASLGFAVPSAAFEAAGELPVLKQIKQGVVDPVLSFTHEKVGQAMEAITSVTPEAYRPIVRDFATPLATLASDLFLFKKAGEVVGKTTTTARDIRSAIKEKGVNNPSQLIEYLVDAAEIRRDNVDLQRLLNDPVAKEQLGEQFIQVLGEMRDPKNISDLQKIIAEGETPALEGLPPTSQLKALESIIRGEKKAAEPQVKTKVWDEAQRLQDILQPQINKLAKGKGVIKLFEKGKDISNLVKVKEKGGRTEITRDEFGLLKETPELRKSVGQYYVENPIRVFEQLGEKYKETFYRPIKKAEANKMKGIKKVREELSVLQKAAMKANKKASERIFLSELAKEFRGGEMVKALGKEIPKLTVPELAYAEAMKKLSDELFTQVNEARTYAGKDPIQGRENYITHMQDMNALERLGYSMGLVGKEIYMPKDAHKTGPTYKGEKGRIDIGTMDTAQLKQYAKKIQKDAFAATNRYLENAMEVIHMTPAIAKVRELTNTKITDPATKETYSMKDSSPGTHKYVTEWLDYISGMSPEAHMPKVVTSGLRKLNQNIAFATLSANLHSIAIQPTAILQAATEIGPRWTESGVTSLIKGEGKTAMEKSNVLIGREFETAVKDVKGAGKIKRALGEAGMAPLQFFDAITARATWLGAYNKAKAMKVKDKNGKVREMSEQEAINYADDIVTKTQASAAKSDVAKIQRSDVGKTMTLFQTFVINNFGWLKRDVLGIGNKSISKGQVMKKVATYAIGAGILNVLYEDVLGLPSPFPDPLGEFKKEGGGIEGLKAAGIDVASQIPFLGGLRYGSSPSAAIDLLTAIGNKLGGEEGKAPNAKKGLTNLEIVGQLLGIPGTTQLKRVLQGVKVQAREDGKYDVWARDESGKLIKKTIDIEGFDILKSMMSGPYWTQAAREGREEIEAR